MSAQEKDATFNNAELKKNRSVIDRRNTIHALAFLAPALIIITVFIFYPAIKTFINSLTDSTINMAGPFVGFKNYQELFTSADFWTDVRNTVFYAVLYAPLVTIFALCLALLLNRKNIHGVGFFRTVMFLPYIISMTVAAIAWSFLLNPAVGIIPYWANRLFGIKNLDLLGTSSTAMITIVLITVWKNFGYFMVIFLAGLQGIDQSLYEAASLDGANAWQKFWHITLPGLRPTFNYIIIFGLIGSFQVFDQVFILTSGGPDRQTETLVYRIYTEAFGNGRISYASAISYVLLIMTLILGLIQLITDQRREKSELGR
jgi:multiple sugar transport system permease protein